VNSLSALFTRSAVSPVADRPVDVERGTRSDAGVKAPPLLRFPALPPERLFLGVAVGLVFAYLGLTRLTGEWHWMSDMHFFYDSASVFAGEHRDILHDPEARVAAGLGPSAGLETFPYPATLAPLFLPFTLTGLETARLVFLALEFAIGALLVALAYRWSRDAWLAGFVALALLSSFTFYEALRFNQLAPIFAVLLCLALLNLTGGRRLHGAILLGVLALKPSLALLPIAFLAWRRERHLFSVAVGVAVTIVFAIPLVLVGVGGLVDYVEQLWRYRAEAFVLDGRFTAGSAWMLNWHGFIGRLTGADPDRDLVTLLQILTLAVTLKVWSRGDVFCGLLAAIIATLLIMPHAVWYDWLVLLGVAPFAAYMHRSSSLLGLLLLLHFTTSLDSYIVVTMPSTATFVFTTPLVAMAILLHLAFSPSVRVESIGDSAELETPEPQRVPAGTAG
jgi:hypothetical protein